MYLITATLGGYRMSLDHLQAFIRQGNQEVIEEHQEEERNEPKPILTARIERERQSIERYKEISENIRKSERLRADISKGIKNNEPIDDLLLIALECISLMTGDNTWYKQNIEHLEGRL